MGTKRPCLDTDYYATYNLPHVRLVNLKKTPLVEITEQGVRTSDEDFEFDSIVFATGFDAMTGSLTAFDIAGRDGALLKERWAEGPRTYLGVATAGFPNLWMITGPGSPSVLTNMMISIEQHVDWIADAITYLRDHDEQVLEPTVEAQDAWTDHVTEVGNTTLYPSANSWYMGSNVPGKPRVFLPYIGGAGVLPRRVRRRRRQGLRRLHPRLTRQPVFSVRERSQRAPDPSRWTRQGRHGRSRPRRPAR